MSKEIKTGKDVIREFFEQIKGVPNTHEDTVSAIVGLYNDTKMTESQIQNSLDEILRLELQNIEDDNEQN